MKSSRNASHVTVSASLLIVAMAFVASSGGIDEPIWFKFAVLGVGIVLLFAAIITLARHRKGEGAPE